jgi:type IV pilus assembly protein PilZ
MDAVSMDVSEVRRYRRLPADVRVFTRGSWVPFAEDSLDLSEGGVGIVTRRPMPVGTRALFALAIPHSDLVIELPGVVVWATEGAMGVSFEHQHPMLSGYVDRLRKAADSI